VEIQAALLPTRILQAIGINSYTPPSTTPIAIQEKIPPLAKWNMHLLQKYCLAEDGQTVKILINMEEVVLVSKRPKAIIKALQVYSSYIREDIRQMIAEHPQDEHHCLLSRQIATDDAVDTIVGSLRNESPLHLALTHVTLSITHAQKLAAAISENNTLTDIHISGFRNQSPILSTLLHGLREHKSIRNLNLMDNTFEPETIRVFLEILAVTKFLNLNLCFTALDHKSVLDIEKVVSGNKLTLNMQIHPGEDEMVSWLGRHYLGIEQKH